MSNITWYKGGIDNWFSFNWSRFRTPKSKYFIKAKPKIYFGKWNRLLGFPLCLYSVARIFDFSKTSLIWKDKFGTPRYEFPPMVKITFFRYFSILIVWNVKEDWDNDIIIDHYWEQLLWTVEYWDNNLQKAIENWPWFNNNESTWDNRWLRKRYRNNNFKCKVNEEF